MAMINERLASSIASTLLYTSQSVLLLGEPGIGKSAIILNLEKTFETYSGKPTKVFVIQVNLISDRDTLYGMRQHLGTDPADGKERLEFRFIPYFEVQVAIDYARMNPDHNVIINFDEINRTEPDVTSALLSVPTTRSLAMALFPDNCYFMATGNDRGNICALDEASISRFKLMYVNASAIDWIKYSENRPEGLSPYIKKALIQNPELIFSRPTTADINSANRINQVNDEFGAADEVWQITTPRTLTALNSWLQNVDTKALKRLEATDSTSLEHHSELYEEIVGFIGPTYLARNIYDRICSELNKDQHQVRASESIIPHPKLEEVKKSWAKGVNPDAKVLTKFSNDDWAHILFNFITSDDPKVRDYILYILDEDLVSDLPSDDLITQVLQPIIQHGLIQPAHKRLLKSHASSIANYVRQYL